jgi:hypothetical protein
MSTSSTQPNDALRQAIIDTHSADSTQLSMSISAEAAALYRYLTGRELGYPADGTTVEDLERHRLAALGGVIAVELFQHFGNTDDGTHLETAAEHFLGHPRLTEHAQAILEQLVNAVGPVIAAALPHLFILDPPGADEFVRLCTRMYRDLGESTGGPLHNQLEHEQLDWLIGERADEQITICRQALEHIGLGQVQALEYVDLDAPDAWRRAYYFQDNPAALHCAIDILTITREWTEDQAWLIYEPWSVSINRKGCNAC